MRIAAQDSTAIGPLCQRQATPAKLPAPSLGAQGVARLALPALGHEHDPKAVWILDRDPVHGPVWVDRCNGIDAEVRNHRLYG